MGGVVYEKKASAHGGTITVVERSEGGLGQGGQAMA